jgi:serine protease Do
MFDPIRAKARIIVFTSAAFIGGVAFASGLEWTAGTHAASILQTPPTVEGRPVADLSEAFVSIAESVTPAVVNISSERTQQVRGHQGIPEQFRRFFDIPEAPEGEVPVGGTGTGFVISRDGHIMTNNHVIEDATRIRVTLRDRRQFDAQVIGRDPTTDVAVIKIDASDLAVARLGRSESARVGEWVMAIGNPMGLDFTVTSGIVSARGRGNLGILGRSLGAERQLAIEDFIQTDAAINPGNSGGPLVNLRGEVIGINTAIASGTGTFTGYGFAVPIDLARRVADDLIQYGRSRRPIMGVTIRPVLPEDAEAFRLPQVSGAVVNDFSEQSPAQRAGLQRGDVIVAIDGRPISQSNELQRVIATRRPGETVDVDIIRYGERRQVRVQLTEAAAPETPAAPERTRARGEQRLGIEVQPITQELARQHNLQGTEGVVITEVTRFSPAARAGIRPGDRLVAIDRQPVRDVAQVQRVITSKRPGEVVSLDVETSGRDRQVIRSIINVRIPE